MCLRKRRQIWGDVVLSNIVEYSYLAHTISTLWKMVCLCVHFHLFNLLVKCSAKNDAICTSLYKRRLLSVQFWLSLCKQNGDIAQQFWQFSNIYLFIYRRRKDHVATYTVGKSTYIITCTETQSQRIKNKRKHYMKNQIKMLLWTVTIYV